MSLVQEDDFDFNLFHGDLLDPNKIENKQIKEHQVFFLFLTKN